MAREQNGALAKQIARSSLLEASRKRAVCCRNCESQKQVRVPSQPYHTRRSKWKNGQRECLDPKSNIKVPHGMRCIKVVRPLKSIRFRPRRLCFLCWKHHGIWHSPPRNDLHNDKYGILDKLISVIQRLYVSDTDVTDVILQTAE